MLSAAGLLLSFSCRRVAVLRRNPLISVLSSPTPCPHQAAYRFRLGLRPHRKNFRLWRHRSQPSMPWCLPEGRYRRSRRARAGRPSNRWPLAGKGPRTGARVAGCRRGPCRTRSRLARKGPRSRRSVPRNVPPVIDRERRRRNHPRRNTRRGRGQSRTGNSREPTCRAPPCQRPRSRIQRSENRR